MAVIIDVILATVFCGMTLVFMRLSLHEVCCAKINFASFAYNRLAITSSGTITLCSAANVESSTTCLLGGGSVTGMDFRSLFGITGRYLSASSASRRFTGEISRT